MTFQTGAREISTVMETEKDNAKPDHPADTPRGETPIPAELEGAVSAPQKAIVSSQGQGAAPAWPPQPTVLTLQDLLDLPRQILPEQTYIHLQNAGREAILAVVSLFNSIKKGQASYREGKVRTHIVVA